MLGRAALPLLSARIGVLNAGQATSHEGATMQARHIRIAWGLFWLFFGLFTAGCNKAGGGDETITVGAYLSLSGQQSTFGTDTKEGVEMATAEVNAKGGIKGK